MTELEFIKNDLNYEVSIHDVNKENKLIATYYPSIDYLQINEKGYKVEKIIKANIVKTEKITKELVRRIYITYGK